MKPFTRGLAVAVLQCILVLSIAGKYAIDRQQLPRAWAKAAPYDPNLPIRGRYVSLQLQVDAPPDATGSYRSARLSIRDNRLYATPEGGEGWRPPGNGLARIRRPGPQSTWSLAEPIAYFLPEHVADPSIRASGEELWVEVSVPHQGPPRPIRLAVKKAGTMTPLPLN